eukprot:CAMPEP_0201557732 /NCGR_PEP_ID=MMETSP0173_2-20130828/63640_1 /ASSEMBLY_ACC=CAM_ASM_000268 /TAXON_ID=218659 /ORGANISM="Vexillifera sp., Strain DIVA3 564/2" /LENGTH=492 /DNA_ID=CAMNT_0047970751 /DNA_START=18 /DNA_END=1493 /DNA_ORIENTATION=+
MASDSDSISLRSSSKRLPWWKKLFSRSKSSDGGDRNEIDFEKFIKYREKERQQYYQAKNQLDTYRASVKNKEEKKRKERKAGNQNSKKVSSATETTTTPATGSVSTSSNRIVVFSKLDELPDDQKEKLDEIGVERKVLAANLDTLAQVLSFCDKKRPKRRFYTPAQYKIISADGYSKTKHCNRHKPRMSAAHEDLFEKLTVREAKKRYKLSHFLGEGGFGGVIEAKILQKNLHPEFSRVAIKYQEVPDPYTSKLIDHEASILHFCDNPGIVRMFGGLEICNELWIVMELLEGGTLKQAAESSNTWEESEIAYVAERMLHAIDYLHENKLVHRDLKNLNVMFTVSAEVKLIDFGLCADLTHGPTIAMLGSPFWMPPEMIRGQKHSFNVDIWSFMICMLELANRRPPNCKNVRKALFTTAVFGLGDDYGLEDPSKWSDKFKSFLSCGLQMDPEKRSSAKELLKHEFIEQKTTKTHMSRKLSSIFTLNTLAASGI